VSESLGFDGNGEVLILEKVISLRVIQVGAVLLNLPGSSVAMFSA